jgi:hypothetical protein
LEGGVNRDEENAILALKNAWNGAVAATDRLRELAPAVDSLPDTTSLTAVDFETYHRAAMAQAIAAQALRGLLETLQERAGRQQP